MGNVGLVRRGERYIFDAFYGESCEKLLDDAPEIFTVLILVRNVAAGEKNGSLSPETNPLVLLL